MMVPLVFLPPLRFPAWNSREAVKKCTSLGIVSGSATRKNRLNAQN
jgi:hypothetical protein